MSTGIDIPRTAGTTWVRVCPAEAVATSCGVTALVAGRQVAVFRDDRGVLYAVDNRDPFTGANVLSRGLVGEHGGTPTVASPLRKHRFDLRTGVCIDETSVSVARHEVREQDGWIHVGVRDAGDVADICP